MVATNGLQRQELPKGHSLTFELHLESAAKFGGVRYQYTHLLQYFSVFVVQSWCFSVSFVHEAMSRVFMLHDGSDGR